MPSLRQKVTTYFRQLSFIADTRDGNQRNSQKDEDDGNFIIKYLEGRKERMFSPGPEIFHGQSPTDLPTFKIGNYPTGSNSVTAACTGPDEGLTGIKRSKLHLSASFADDIDFIDTIQDGDCYDVRKSIKASTGTMATCNRQSLIKTNRLNSNRKQSNGSISAINDQNANKTTGMRSRKNSKTSLANVSKENTNAINTSHTNSIYEGSLNNKATTIVLSMVCSKTTPAANDSLNDQNKKNLCNPKTDSTTTAGSGAGLITTPASLKSNDQDATTVHTTPKLLEDTTERLLRNAVLNECGTHDMVAETIAGVHNWQMETDSAYGISVSLYENNMLTKEPMGNPIADCYGIVARGDTAAMALADGVNWGDGARLAARSAVHGCLDYLDRAIFGIAHECMATTTQEVFISLLRSLWEGHGCILEVGGALSTLTIAVVLPLTPETAEDKEVTKYVVCACNVGDSLGYVYSKKYGVREFTQASHDITSMRDMRDALGALGPADGNKPELSNLTFSMTIIESGDIVFLTSDGISDNFDPVVGKFAEAWTPDVKLHSANAVKNSTILAPKRQNKSASALYVRLNRNENHSTAGFTARVKKNGTPSNIASSNSAPSRPKYMRSHTVIEPRRLSSAGNPAGHCTNAIPQCKILKSVAGLPLVTGAQRHALTLYRLEDLLSYGINGTFSPCSSSRRLCHLLIDFVRMITSARRKTLEQRELFYKLSKDANGVKREVELNRMQHRAARKRIVDSTAFAALPGKLDHATVVAYTVGGNASNNVAETMSLQRHIRIANHQEAPLAHLHSKEFKETNF